jgi:hypothetical protein
VLGLSPGHSNTSFSGTTIFQDRGQARLLSTTTTVVSWFYKSLGFFRLSLVQAGYAGCLRRQHALLVMHHQGMQKEDGAEFFKDLSVFLSLVTIFL